MPQMAPILWMPLFILIILLLYMMKSTIYFVSNNNLIKTNPKKNNFNASWLW